MNLSKNKIDIKTFRFIFYAYIGTIALFTLLYLIPQANNGNLSFIDSLFVSTSALSVTGLSPISVAGEFTRLGQTFLIFEMQLGGIGILVLISYLFMMLGKRLSISNLLLISADQNQGNLRTIKFLSLSVLLISVFLECIFFSLMYGEVHRIYENSADAIFVTVFHSVASFTNSGFTLFEGDSLAIFTNNPYMLVITVTAIFLGSVGYPAIIECFTNFRKRKSLFTKINFRMHSFLLGVGFVVFLVIEYNGAFEGMNIIDKLSNALFLSATTRSGGLSPIDITTCSITTILLVMLFMFIGGASSSTGGGIRLTTFAVLIAKIKSIVASRSQTILFKKAVTQNVVDRAILICFVFIGMLFVALLLLVSVETKMPIESLLFEAISAISNTGLSLGVTAELSSFSKCVLMALMITGRIGIFTLIYFVFKIDKISKIKYLEEDLAVG